MNPSKEAIESQTFALMGRLHVLLRREIGRVTDIKYMGSDPAYCAHVLELALSVSNPDLHAVSVKLDALFFGESGLFADAGIRPRHADITYSSRVSIPVAHADAAVETQQTEAAAESDQHYVGRLR
jgi:hypothetical protein